MRHWLTKADAPLDRRFVKRFTASQWTVDFPRGAMASLVAGPAADALTVEASFLRLGDLVGLIWDSADGDAHPGQARETARDYSGCVLRFRWQSVGLIALNAVNGPTLTIEGRDAAGEPRAWYVRPWNYASGSPTNAVVTLDFDALDGGYVLPGEADRVDPRDIDRMFLSLVPPDYVGGSASLRASPVAGRVTLSEIRCDGAGSVLAAGDAVAPEHGLGIATAYDDMYHLDPGWVVGEIEAAGFRGTINHYVGMSHYPTLGGDGKVDAVEGLCAAAREWHRGLARAAKAHGYRLIWSLSYEILDQFCPEAWKQRDRSGAAAATGYDPPSTLVSPANGDAIDYLGRIAAELVGLSLEAGLEPLFQVGEPWWWVTRDGRICLYDDAAVTAFGGAPVAIDDVGATLDAQKKALLDQAGVLLAASTAAIVTAAQAEAPATVSHLLAYLPGLLDPARPEVRRANLPLGWASPGYDVLQLEDYEWVTGGHAGRRAAALVTVEARLGYPAGQQHYLAGFARDGEPGDWRAILDAAGAARARGVAEVLIWAWPQVARDGLTIFGEEDDVAPFEDVLFPIAIGQEASVAPGFSTNIVTAASGHEYRNVNWSQARLRFDAGPGVRGEEELGTLIAFFRARRGPAQGFRFRDPYDHSSAAMQGVPGADDQPIGTGDAAETRFALIKLYGGEERRRITRPVAGSVRVSVDGVEVSSGWTLEPGGMIAFDEAPEVGAAIRAGFLFDVPVRFGEDRLEINRASFLAGEAPSVTLIEVRED